MILPPCHPHPMPFPTFSFLPQGQPPRLSEAVGDFLRREQLLPKQRAAHQGKRRGRGVGWGADVPIGSFCENSSWRLFGPWATVGGHSGGGRPWSKEGAGQGCCRALGGEGRDQSPLGPCWFPPGPQGWMGSRLRSPPSPAQPAPREARRCRSSPSTAPEGRAPCPPRDCPAGASGPESQ